MSLLSLFRGAQEQNESRALTAWGDWNPSRSGQVTGYTQYNLSGVWACETLIADAIATMPVDVYRSTPDGRVDVTLPRWIERPNPTSNRVDFDTQRILSLLGWGNSYSLLIPGEGGLERWPLDPWRVRCEQVGYERRYFIDGDAVESQHVQHIAGYRRPGDPAGMSVIEQAAAGLTASTAAENLAKNIYENGLNPSGVVEIPEMPADTAAATIERIADRIRQWYGGAKNAGKPLVLTGGTTWKQMAVTPADAQFLETRLFQLEEIARWFRVPPHMIGHIDKESSWGAGIEQQSLGFVRYTLMPWIVRLEAADSALLPRSQFLKYNVNALVRADLKTRFEAYKMAREGGWMSADDVRELEDERPLPDGRGAVYLQPLNYVEAGSTPDSPGPTPPGDPNGPQ